MTVSLSGDRAVPIHQAILESPRSHLSPAWRCKTLIPEGSPFVMVGASQAAGWNGGDWSWVRV